MNKVNIIANFVLIVALSACTIPQKPASEVLPAADFAESSTPSPQPTSTPIPLPTLTPTPPPAARLLNADIAFNNGDFDAAYDEYRSAYEFSQDNAIKASALVRMAVISNARADSVKALDQFRQTIALDGGADQTSLAHFNLALLYSSLQRYEEAAAAYQLYLDLKPGILAPIVYERIGDLYNQAGLYQQSIDAYAQSLDSGYDQPTILDLKIAKNQSALGEYSSALEKFNTIFNNSSNEYTRAQVDLLVGQIYLSQGDTASAYERFQDAVNNYPRAYDSYSALSALVEAGEPVNELNRGMIDYYVGQYGISAEVLRLYIKDNELHDGTAHYFRALSLTQNGLYDEAITEWEALITDHPGDRFWGNAWDEKAYTQWFYLGKYPQAAETLLTFIANAPQDGLAASMLFEAGRIYERDDNLALAAATWERLPGEYPNTEYAYMGIFFSGISYFRLGNYEAASNAFQRALLLSTELGEISGAYFWLGKIKEIQGDLPAANQAWEQGLQIDPTGYYSERSRDKLTGKLPFEQCTVLDLAIDYDADQPEADQWMVDQFNLDPGINLSDTTPLLSDERIQRASEYWRLGLKTEARNEISNYRDGISNDPVLLYKLSRWLLDMGIFRESILAARQVLTLAGLDDTATLNAPIYFSHIRFGTYYKDLVVPAAQENGLDPLLVFSVIRQESLFESYITSVAGAEGLMQMMPATATEVTSQSGWPPVFLKEDILRPHISIKLGSYYLAQQVRLEDGDVFAGLAAYNGGPGNAAAWKARAGNDPDLLLEVIRFKETRNYLRAIVELYNIYRGFYCRE